jgi:hypothetical protein
MYEKISAIGIRATNFLETAWNEPKCVSTGSDTKNECTDEGQPQITALLMELKTGIE